MERSKWLHSGFTISPTLHQQSLDQPEEQQKSASEQAATEQAAVTLSLGRGFFLFFLFF